MRLSISAKIFVGFLAVLATFGGVALYGALTMRRLGDELRLVSRGYLQLRLEVSELQNGHSNLLKVLVEQMTKAEGPLKAPRFVKFAIDDARRSRLKQQMPQALADVTSLEALHSSSEEHALLHHLRARLEKVEGEFRADEELFDEVYGPIGDQPLATAGLDPERAHVAAGMLLRREQAIKRDLNNLSAELRLRAQQAGLRLEESENRAVWATLLVTVLALLVGLAVMWMATRAVRPLRRLAERAKEIARGDYKQRVDESSGDEIGALGREFNAMAGALDEREQKLIRSERLAAVGKIAAQITHEVRNPLSSIGLNAEMLEEEIDQLASKLDAQAAPRTPEAALEAKALVRAIVKEVDRLTEITEEYLRFARLPRPRLEREDLGEIVSSLLAFVRPELDARKIAIEAHLPPLPAVAADEHQLRQALLNLLRNAAEAMGAGGRLTVRAESAEQAIVLSIADTGQGIAPDDLAKIFDPFFTTKQGGTGLGLALTQQIVVEHGGTLAVKSALGRGTTFTVRLPALEPAAPSVGLAPSGAQG
ncbi:MAG: ATP-binding protein [Polyangia bacterium]